MTMDFDSDEGAILRAVDRQARHYGMTAEDWVLYAWHLVVERDLDLAAKNTKRHEKAPDGLNSAEQREVFLQKVTEGAKG